MRFEDDDLLLPPGEAGSARRTVRVLLYREPYVNDHIIVRYVRLGDLVPLAVVVVAALRALLGVPLVLRPAEVYGLADAQPHHVDPVHTHGCLLFAASTDGYGQSEGVGDGLDHVSQGHPGFRGVESQLGSEVAFRLLPGEKLSALADYDGLLIVAARKSVDDRAGYIQQIVRG